MMDIKSNVKMKNKQFIKRFCARADNPQEAYNISGELRRFTDFIYTLHMKEVNV
ncbi:MAG: hypothetical protein ACI4KR_09810 [Ruminiclostridium sp.]